MGTAPREPTLTLDPARPACVHRWSHSRDLCSAVHRVLAVIATSDAAPSGADAHRVAVAQQPQGGRAVWPWLAWAGLWAPALVDFFTPLLYNARIPVSTSWLIIPLCSPNTQAPVLIPAAAATAVCLTGMGMALLARRPWIWVLAMWLAPWAHQAVMSVVPSHFGC